jgi:5-methyltetrahydrofolate--homocysteine methyltransferase
MLEQIYESVVGGDASGAVDSVQKALDAGVDPAKILNEGMISAMAEIGAQFERHEAFVPEMLIAARAMKAGLEILRPRLIEADIQPVGKVVLGTVKGDLHDIGKNLVGMMFEGAGFTVLDLGTDVPASRFVEAVQEHRANFVGLSALLTTTMPLMGEVVEALRESGLREQVKVIVGGAPVTQAFADKIGADLYAPDASSAASRAKASLMPSS